MLRGLRRFHDIGLGMTLSGAEPDDAIVINKLVGHAQA